MRVPGTLGLSVGGAPRQCPPRATRSVDATCDGDRDASAAGAQVKCTNRAVCSLVEQAALTKVGQRRIHKGLGARPGDQRAAIELEFAPMEAPLANDVLHGLVVPGTPHERPQLGKLLRRGGPVRMHVERHSVAAEHVTEQQVRTQPGRLNATFTEKSRNPRTKAARRP